MRDAINLIIVVAFSVILSVTALFSFFGNPPSEDVFKGFVLLALANIFLYTYTTKEDL